MENCKCKCSSFFHILLVLLLVAGAAYGGYYYAMNQTEPDVVADEETTETTTDEPNEVDTGIDTYTVTATYAQDAYLSCVTIDFDETELAKLPEEMQDLTFTCVEDGYDLFGELELDETGEAEVTLGNISVEEGAYGSHATVKVFEVEVEKTYVESTGNNDTETLYTNEDFGYSFAIPSGFEITYDDVYMEFGEFSWHKLSLTNESANFVFEANPDGYGPLFFDKTYELEEIDGKLTIVSEEVITDNPEDETEPRVWLGASIEASNGNHYLLQFLYPESGKDLEEMFKDIIESIELF